MRKPELGFASLLLQRSRAAGARLFADEFNGFLEWGGAGPGCDGTKLAEFPSGVVTLFVTRLLGRS